MRVRRRVHDVGNQLPSFGEIRLPFDNAAVFELGLEEGPDLGLVEAAIAGFNATHPIWCFAGVRSPPDGSPSTTRGSSRALKNP